MARITEALLKAEREKEGYDRHYISKLQDEPTIDSHLISYLDERSLVVEQCKKLWANIQALDLINPLKSLGITSAVKGEGKSIMTLNLAITIARYFTRKILVVDCNYRNPCIHRLLGIGDKNKTRAKTRPVIPIVSISYDRKAGRLSIVGEEKVVDGAEPFSLSKSAFDLIERNWIDHDYVFVDSSPVLSSGDDLLLSRVDGVILAVRIGSTDRRAVLKAIDLLRDRKVRLIGCAPTCIHEGVDFAYKQKT